MMETSSDAQPLLCVLAEETRKKFSKGIRLMSLTELGVSTFNRAVSLKHTHFLTRRIMKKEGFTRGRYKSIVVLEPNPNDPEEVWRHSTKIAKESGGKLVANQRGHLHGCLMKNHLVEGLLCLKFGGVLWDDDGLPMKPPPRSVAGEEDERHKELWDALDEGVWVEVISWKAVEQARDGVAAIMLADNMDQAHSMPEHEVELFSTVWKECQDAKSLTGNKHWHAVDQAVSQKSAGAWTNDDRVHMYNLSKQIGQIHQKALALFHFHFVNATALRVEVRFFGVLSELGDAHPWCKIAVLAAQYMSDQTDYVHSGRGFIAQGISQTKVRYVAKDKQKLEEAENFLQQVLVARYSSTELEPAELKICCALIVRVGEALHKSRRLHGDDEEVGALAKAEAKFLKDLEDSGLAHAGAPVLKETCKVMAAVAAKASKKSTKATAVSQLCPDDKPTLKFNSSGSLVHDAEYVASINKIAKGTRVEVSRQVRKVKRGDRGQVEGFTKDSAMVLLDRDSSTVAVPVDALRVEAQSAENADPIAPPESKEQSHAMEGGNWAKMDEEEASSMLRSYTQAALFQLMNACGADHTKLAVSENGEFRARRALGVRDITLVPYTEDIRTEDQARDLLPQQDFVTVQVSTQGSTESLFYLVRPQGVSEEAGADVRHSEQAGNQSESAKERPFWSVHRHGRSSPVVNAPNLEEYRLEMTGNASFKIEGDLYKAVAKKCMVTVRIPVLSNTAPLRQGDVLQAKPGAQAKPVNHRLTGKRKIED